MNPTPNNPIVLNDDGSISALVYQGRTFRLNAVHSGLAEANGYKARFGITNRYGNELLASASTEDGSIVLEPVDDGTAIRIVVSDEQTGLITARSGKLDLVLENASGDEDPVLVGDWTLWKQVTP